MHSINCLSQLQSGIRKMSTLRLALVQLAVDSNKQNNIERAIKYVEQAKEKGAELIILPECFNSPYGTKYFSKYAEPIPTGETSIKLSEAAKKYQVYIIAGSIPEKADDEALYNTCTVWDDKGQLVVKHKKMHLFDIDIKGKISFFESETLSAGNTLSTFQLKNCKIGLGICYDIRFEEMARLYRNRGCQMLIYPAAFNMTTGPLHWELLQRARANDNQCYVICVSPARNNDSDYVAWGHSQLTNPRGEVMHDLGTNENMVVTDIDLTIVDEVRNQIPTFKQRRTDIYDTIYKNKE